MSQCYFLLTYNTRSNQTRVVYLGKDLSKEAIRLTRLQLWNGSDYGAEPQLISDAQMSLKAVVVAFVTIAPSGSSLFFSVVDRFAHHLIDPQSGAFSIPTLFDEIGESLILEYLGSNFLKLSLAAVTPGVESLSRSDEQELINIVSLSDASSIPHPTAMGQFPQQSDSDENVIYVPLSCSLDANNPQRVSSYLLGSFDEDTPKELTLDLDATQQNPDDRFSDEVFNVPLQESSLNVSPGE